MANILTNRAEVGGLFDGANIINWTELSVELSALDIKKTADKKIWVKDDLEYTIVVTNIDERDPEDPTPSLPVENVVVTDKILPEIAKLIDNSVAIDGTLTTDYNYDPTTGILTVELGTIVYGTPKTITFRVEFPQP